MQVCAVYLSKVEHESILGYTYVCYSEAERKEEAKKRLEKRLEKRENT